MESESIVDYLKSSLGKPWPLVANGSPKANITTTTQLDGLYPEWDEFYLLVCDICGIIIKPQALEKHLATKHQVNVQGNTNHHHHHHHHHYHNHNHTPNHNRNHTSNHHNHNHHHQNYRHSNSNNNSDANNSSSQQQGSQQNHSHASTNNCNNHESVNCVNKNNNKNNTHDPVLVNTHSHSPPLIKKLHLDITPDINNHYNNGDGQQQNNNKKQPQPQPQPQQIQQQTIPPRLWGGKHALDSVPRPAITRRPCDWVKLRLAPNTNPETLSATLSRYQDRKWRNAFNVLKEAFF